MLRVMKMHIWLLLAASCGGPATTGSTTAVEQPGLGVAPSPTRVVCYAGPLVQPGREPTMAVERRTFDEAKATVTVERTQLGAEVVTSTNLWHVTGSTFTVEYRGSTRGDGRSTDKDDAAARAMVMKGTLSGPAWQWTGWTTATELTDRGKQITINSVTEVTPTGLRAKITLDGNEVGTTELTTFDCADYDRRRANPA